MTLFATSVSACPDDGEGLAYVYSRDESKDYCFSLSRFNDQQDEGLIEVMVLDQIVARTKMLRVTLEATRLLATFDASTAKWLGHQDYELHFTVDAETLSQMAGSLKRMFRDITGLTVRILQEN